MAKLDEWYACRLTFLDIEFILLDIMALQTGKMGGILRAEI